MAANVFELTAFQRDLLYVIFGLEQPSGQDVRSELEGKYDDITHGQLYPNLDTLVEKGLARKGTLDRRTNYYEITRDGEIALRRRREWENLYFGIEL
jgi:DNA-binding PadR family transcriptional regulator